MPKHVREYRRAENSMRPGAILVILFVVLGVAITALVFVGTRGNSDSAAGDQSTQTGTVASTNSDTDPAATGDGKQNGSGTTENSTNPTDNTEAGGGSSSTADTTAGSTASNDKAQSSTGANGTSSSKSGSTDSSTNSSSATAGSTSGAASARMGNSLLNGEEDEDGDTGAESNDGEEGESTSGRTTSSRSSSTSSDGASGSSGWIEGEACATTASDTGPTTASDIQWDDDEAQIGLDLSSDQTGRFGDYVEIRYGDQTITAQVVDCGRYNAGSSGIIINPGVFEEFGVDDADEWGRRDVSYRFV